MNELDFYYRAFREYKTLLKNNERGNRLSLAVQKAASKEDVLDVVRTRVVVDEVWVDMIEKCLPFVDNCIKEDRQFIRREGEIVIIEKAKKVSRASVSHLARHSNLITRLPENEDEALTPERIYIEENESNYAVYENRFLYMLLCYVRDFVELRYMKISALGNQYTASFVMKRQVENESRSISYDVVFHEKSKNDPRSKFDAASYSIIERLEAIRVWVSSLLMTSLMKEVSKVPMIRPPITRTNILKMDNNFKVAVELYDYLAGYTEDGYRIEEIRKSLAPFADSCARSVSELLPLTSFLVYEFGNGIERDLKRAFDEEEAARQKAAEEEEKRRLEEMRQKLATTGKGADEYILMLEDRVRHIEEAEARLEQRIQKTQESLALCEKRNEVLSRLAHELEERDKETAIRFKAEVEAHDAQVASLVDEHKEKLALVEAEKAKALASASAEKESALASQAERFREKTADIVAENDTLKQQNEVYAIRNLELEARARAYRHKEGLPEEENMTTEERFKELEREREWFETYFKDTWKKTKKQIRKDVLWSAFSAKRKNKGADADLASEVPEEDLPKAEILEVDAPEEDLPETDE